MNPTLSVCWTSFGVGHDVHGAYWLLLCFDVVILRSQNVYFIVSISFPSQKSARTKATVLIMKLSLPAVIFQSK